MYRSFIEAEQMPEFFTDKHGTVHPITGRDMPAPVKHKLSLTAKIAIPVATLGLLLATKRGQGALKMGWRGAKSAVKGVKVGVGGIGTAAHAIKKVASKLIPKSAEAKRTEALISQIKQFKQTHAATKAAEQARAPVEGVWSAFKRGFKYERAKIRGVPEATKKIMSSKAQPFGTISQMGIEKFIRSSTGKLMPVPKLGPQKVIPGAPGTSGRSFIKILSPEMAKQFRQPLAGTVAPRPRSEFWKRAGIKIKGLLRKRNI